MIAVLIVSLAVLSCAGQATGILLLLHQRQAAQAVLAQDSRHVIDGGNVLGEADGPNASTAFDDLARAMSASKSVLAALCVGLVSGLAATVLGLFGPE